MTPTTDIVARLREWAAEKIAIGSIPITTYNHTRKLKIGAGLYNALPELIDRIEALEAEVATLRAALEPFAELGATNWTLMECFSRRTCDIEQADQLAAALREARKRRQK